MLFIDKIHLSCNHEYSSQSLNVTMSFHRQYLIYVQCYIVMLCDFVASRPKFAYYVSLESNEPKSS